MHYYKIVLSGKVPGESGLTEKVLRRKIKLELDCKLQISRNLDLSITLHKEMYLHIHSVYAELFQGGKFKIRSVMQLR